MGIPAPRRHGFLDPERFGPSILETIRDRLDVVGLIPRTPGSGGYAVGGRRHY